MKLFRKCNVSVAGLALLTAGLVVVSGCDSSDDDVTPSPTVDAHAGHDHGPDGHDHAEGEGHAGHNHGGDAMAEASSHDGTDASTLGPAEVEGQTVSVKIHGGMSPGSVGHMDVMVDGEKSPEVVRLWVGDEEAVGVRKGRAESTGPGTFHGHTTNPDPMPAGAKLWVEVQNSDGSIVTASFDLSLLGQD